MLPTPATWGPDADPRNDKARARLPQHPGLVLHEGVDLLNVAHHTLRDQAATTPLVRNPLATPRVSTGEAGGGTVRKDDAPMRANSASDSIGKQALTGKRSEQQSIPGTPKARIKVVRPMPLTTSGRLEYVAACECGAKHRHVGAGIKRPPCGSPRYLLCPRGMDCSKLYRDKVSGGAA